MKVLNHAWMSNGGLRGLAQGYGGYRADLPSQLSIQVDSNPEKGSKGPHKHEDHTNHGFWIAPCLAAPWNQNVGSLWLCGLWGPKAAKALGALGLGFMISGLGCWAQKPEAIICRPTDLAINY